MQRAWDTMIVSTVRSKGHDFVVASGGLVAAAAAAAAVKAAAGFVLVDAASRSFVFSVFSFFFSSSFV